jgi:glycine/D-amino acid oxidase-like deaminating enzyme
VEGVEVSMNKQQRADVVVVGAGLGGLLVAADLVDLGHRVVVLEAGRAPGGRASTDEVGGYLLDRGAHALFRGGPLEAALRRRGLDVGQPVSPLDAGVVVDGAVRGPGAWLASRRRRGQAWRRVAQVACYTGQVERLEAGRRGRQVRRSLLQGVRYVSGGWQGWATALTDQVRRGGGQVRCGVAVRRLDPLGVTTDEGEVRAEHVVLAMGAHRVQALTGVDLGLAPPSFVGARQVVVGRRARRGPRAVMSLDHPVFASDFSAVVSLGPDDGQVWQLVHYDPSAAGARDHTDAVLDAWSPGWREHLLHDRWLPRMPSWSSLGPARPVDALGAGRWLVGDAFDGRWALADAVAASASAVVRGIVARRDREAA